MTAIDVKTVAVIGAGVSGVAAAHHLRSATLDVTVFERGRKAGGVWVFDERAPIEPDYPSIKPSRGDLPAVIPHTGAKWARADSPMEHQGDFDLSLYHAPPGPAYAGLKNNVDTQQMELQMHGWRPGIADFVPHWELAQYIQAAAASNGLSDTIRFQTRVDLLEKHGDRWAVQTTTLSQDAINGTIQSSDTAYFDAVVVASGHYHACHVPDIPGLREWKSQWPDRIQHSKGYRFPDKYLGQNVLLIGSGVSSTDIARELGPIAHQIYQVSRGGVLDLPEALLPANSERVAEIARFTLPETMFTLTEKSPLPGIIKLKDGRVLQGIHSVILATGYHMSYPFLPELHADNVTSEAADDITLVTDGQQTHNLHEDIFYIPDPTLAFIGVPYHVATFSLFEFQAIALAAVYSGRTLLPSQDDMRTTYRSRLGTRGTGRFFHSLKDPGAEVAYVNALVELVNKDISRTEKMRGHTEKWLDGYKKRQEKIAQLLKS